MGRAVIAMTAVRQGTCVSPIKITDHSDARPPMDAMGITALPRCSYVVTRSRPYPLPQPSDVFPTANR